MNLVISGKYRNFHIVCTKEHMGHPLQRKNLLDLAKNLKGPIIEIGSLTSNKAVSFRDDFKGQEYVGLDMQKGPGVDIVCDLEKGIGNLKENYFNFMICLTVLEHTQRPWIVVENMKRLLKPGGWMYLSVPWIWRYHPYPDDYWRFSLRCISKILFPEFKWKWSGYLKIVKPEIGCEIIPVDLKDVNKKENIDKARNLTPYHLVDMFGHKPL